MTKTLPNTVTHLDIFKTVAVVFMIIDHIGLYFLEALPALQDWFRLFGRMGGAPIWLFLVGYAASRNIPDKWIIGAVMLIVADYVILGRVIPMNILITIIIARLSIDYIMRFVLKSRYIFWLSILILIALFMGSKMIAEYGTMGILYAMVGYAARHKEQMFEQSFFTIKDYYALLFATIMAYTVLETAVFGFTELQTFLLLLMTAGMMYLTTTMQPMTFDHIQGRAKEILMFGGRKNLEIYVAHLLLFKFLLLVILALK